jgi:hypothetical protein
VDRLRNIGIKVPFSLGEVTVGIDEPSPSAGVSLEAAIYDLENGSERIKWFEEVSVTAGDLDTVRRTNELRRRR